MKAYYHFISRLLYGHHRRLKIFLVAALFALTACDNGNSPIDSNKNQKIHDVIVSKIEEKMMPVILSVPGTVVSQNHLKVASRITGFIEKITVDEGDIVKPGDILVEIDSAQVEAAIKGADAAVLAAKADLLDAEDDVIRIKKLVQSKTVAEDDLRNAMVRRAQAKATLAAAEAEVISKRQDRRYSHITSPVHARVRERLRDPGDLATTGEAILQLDVVGDLEFEIYLPSTSIGNVNTGQVVTVQFEASGKLLEATITNIVLSADEVTRRYKVRLLLPSDARLTPGQYGQAQIILRNESVIVIPVSAITERAGVKGVFIADASKKLRFRSVRLGKIWQDLREVVAGLESGTFVVINPSTALRDGDVVR